MNAADDRTALAYGVLTGVVGHPAVRHRDTEHLAMRRPWDEPKVLHHIEETLQKGFISHPVFAVLCLTA